VDWALQWSDLKDRANEPVERFSGGMKRRLNIACGLLHSPAIVLLDEPTVGVDPQSRERIYEMLAQLQASGVSVVLTTHHLEEAEQRCERIVIIDRGRIVASGTLRELVRSTLRGTRTVALTLDGAWPPAAGTPAGATIAADGRSLHAEVPDLGESLSRLIQQVGAAGLQATDIKLGGATLHEVFIALTGRELRE
jgi:ABC-2 type transport system ATP-binding protein